MIRCDVLLPAEALSFQDQSSLFLQLEGGVEVSKTYGEVLFETSTGCDVQLLHRYMRNAFASSVFRCEKHQRNGVSLTKLLAIANEGSYDPSSEEIVFVHCVKV